jgi:hypothetical protein
MPIQFSCSCGRKLQAHDEHVGRRVRCPACGAEATVPGTEQAVQPRPRRLATGDDEDASEEHPRRHSRRDEDEEERPRRRRREDDEEEDYEGQRRSSETSGKAVAAVVLGLLSVCLSVFTAVPAMILAIMSFSDIKRSRGRLGGKGLAVAGLILGCVGLAVTAIGVSWGLGYLLDQSVSKVRQATEAVTVTNNMRQMSLGLTNAAAGDGQQRMLAPAICDRNGKPLLSWRVALLPFVDQVPLYNQFRLDEPWDSPSNSRLLTQMPPIYGHPVDAAGTPRGQTCFRVFTGPHTPFPDAIPPYDAHRSGCRFPASFPDGLSNTILVVEAAETVPWTKPDELPYDVTKPLPKLGGRISRGTCVVMADGSVFFLPATISDATLRSAITTDDGKPLGPDWPR